MSFKFSKLNALLRRGNVVMLRILLVLSLSFIPAQFLRAQEESPAKAKVRIAKEAFYADRDKAEAALTGLLTRRLETAKKSGDLKTLEAVQADLDAFRNEGTLPKLVPIREYEIALKLARVKYENVMTAGVKALTQAGSLEEAKVLDAQLKEFQAQAVGAVKPKPEPGPASTKGKVANPGNPIPKVPTVVEISAKREDGYVIGPLSKGSKIALQYKSGSWKAWGGVATENPDTTTHKMCFLAIANLPAGSNSTILTNVPTGTKQTPFIWVADNDYENIVLRISDSDKLEDNPEKEVKYTLQIMTAK